MLAVLGGNENPSPADIKSILDSVSISADDDRVEKLCSELNGKNLDELIAEGKEKMSAVPMGGGARAAGGAAAGGAADEAAAEPEKEESEEEESDADMGFSLFD
eukprot:TRINITY_DN63446_c0_g1_i2.p2 TRINITY_DN63446_c0_g1~~TRINITY_DN63446_c0_g1_i2.p2  ORF type:complete len:104 (+),score=63.89 TRINITY_DN63446_c0_g1_i2:264-575(+)